MFFIHLTHWDFFPTRSTIISVISRQLKWQSRGCKRLQPLPLTHVSKQGGFITGILQLLFDLPTGFQVRVSKTAHLTYSWIEHHFGPRWFTFPVLVFLKSKCFHTFLINFWTFQLEDKFTTEFEKLCKSGAITVDWNASPGIMRPTDYVEKWRMILWEKAFMLFVHPSVKPPFSKGSNFNDLLKVDLLIQRLLYRFYLFLFSSF